MPSRALSVTAPNFARRSASDARSLLRVQVVAHRPAVFQPGADRARQPVVQGRRRREDATRCDPHAWELDGAPLERQRRASCRQADLSGDLRVHGYPDRGVCVGVRAEGIRCRRGAMLGWRFVG
jgi:hypothetical protein